MRLFEVQKGRLLAVALFLLPVCSLPVPDGGLVFASEQLAQVGTADIDTKAVRYRLAIAEAYGNSGVERPAALVSLINDALEYEVAAAEGLIPSQDELKAFALQVDKRSKSPEVLAAVKQVFGDDRAAYRRIYLSPKIVNRRLRSWFSRNADLHRSQRDSIQQAWALVHAGKGFGQAAKSTGLTYAEKTYGGDGQAPPDALKPYIYKTNSMSEPFRKLLDASREDEIVSTIAEDDHSYRVVRLLEKGKGVYKTIEIIAAKEAFEPWFRKQVKEVPVRIQDDDLRASIAAKYPKLLWNLSGEDREGK